MTTATASLLSTAAGKVSNAPSCTVRRLRVSLGTLVAIEASSDSPAAAEVAVEAAFAAVSEVDRRMHPLSSQSDLGRINNAPLRTPVAIHRTTAELLKLAQRLNALTEGVFDPCLPRLPGCLRDIEVRGSAGDATLHGAGCEAICHAPVAIDFGGFAKGFAVDRAIEALVALGCTAGLVNAGGDLRVFGQRTEPILLRRADGRLDMLQLTDAALAVSDAASHDRPPEHQGYYIRGITPADTLVTHYAAVIAQEAVVADALGKCVLLCSEAAAERALLEFCASRVGLAQDPAA